MPRCRGGTKCAQTDDRTSRFAGVAFNLGDGLMKKFASIAMCAALALGAQVAVAGTMLCGGTVIQDGELEPVSEEQVMAACGEPTSRDESGTWVYAKPGEMAKTLRFDTDGNLQSITEEFVGD
jgi:hypothetical protein